MPNNAPKPHLTHFLAIPLYTSSSAPKLTASLSRFAAQVTAGSSSIPQPSTLSTSNDSSAHQAVSYYGKAGDYDSPPPRVTLHPKAIRPPSTLHLTLGVMSLPTPARVQAAGAFLKSLGLSSMLVATPSATTPTPSAKLLPVDPDSDAGQATELGNSDDIAGPLPSPQQLPYLPPLDNLSSSGGSAASWMSVTASNYSGNSSLSDGYQTSVPIEPPGPPLMVTLRGLTPMQTVCATSVLYATPEDPSGRLHSLCEALRCTFVEAGFVIPEDRDLKLHASVVNAVYVPRSSGGEAVKARGTKGWKAGKQKLKIDARDLVEKWGNQVWAEDVMVEKVVICKMGAKIDVDGLERYEVVEEVQMPC